MKWIIWTFFKNGFTPTLFLCLKMVLQLAPRLKNNAFKMRVHFEWLLLWIHKKICLRKSQGTHVMFNRALTGQGQQSSSQVCILTSRYGCSDMAWLGVFLCAAAGCIGIALEWRQNVKEGGKTSVPLAPTFTGLFGRRERVELDWVVHERLRLRIFYGGESAIETWSLNTGCFSNCWIERESWIKGSLL